MSRKDGGRDRRVAWGALSLAALLPACGTNAKGSSDGGETLVATGSAPSCALSSAPDTAYAGRIAALGTDLDALIASFERDFETGGAIDCPAVGASSEDVNAWGNYAFAKLA